MKYLILILYILLLPIKDLLANNILLDNNLSQKNGQIINYYPISKDLFLNEFVSTFNEGDFIRSINRIIDNKNLNIYKFDTNLKFNKKEFEKKYKIKIDDLILEIEKKASLKSNNFFSKLELLVNTNYKLEEIIYFEIKLNDYFRENAIIIPFNNQSIYTRKIELINLARYEIFISYLAKLLREE